MSEIHIISGRTGKTFIVKSYDNYNIDIDMPLTHFKLPEQDASKTQLIKVEGNFKSTTLSWLLNDDGTDISNGTHTPAVITVEQQRAFLEFEFETFGLADQSDHIVVVGVTPTNNKTGKLVKILISKDSAEPNNYRATVSLYVGETIVTAED